MLSRRSLLKTLAACTGAGLFCKVVVAKVDLPAEIMVPASEVCDPVPLPPADSEQGIHNAVFSRWIADHYIEVWLTNGPRRIIPYSKFAGIIRPFKPRERLIVSPYRPFGLMVEKRIKD